ncbi:MAG: hypothetical protein JXR94_23920, partial [Candidatus Hydrogenedentes bacterium]|nr:hypothetical protein [Candidatus Hydrogenedentota bacterium]
MKASLEIRIMHRFWRPVARVALGLALCAVAAAAAHAKDKADARPVSGAASGVAWANPLDGGPIRALVIAPRSTLDDVAALAHCIELRPDVIPLWTSTCLEPPGAPEGQMADATARLLEKRLAHRHDVIVIANVDCAALPEESLARIARQVRGGTGLVIVHPGPNLPPALDALLDRFGRPESPEPGEWAGGLDFSTEWPGGLDIVRTAAPGAGRLVAFDFSGPRANTHCLAPAAPATLFTEPEYLDAYFSFVAKAVRWAAQRDPGPRITHVAPFVAASPASEEIPPSVEQEAIEQLQDMAAAQELKRYVLHLATPVERAYRVRSQVRVVGRRSQVALDYEDELEPGQSSFPLYATAGAGAGFIDVWLLRDGRVVEWHTQPVEFGGWPAIDGIDYSHRLLERNDTLGIHVRLRSLSGRGYAKTALPMDRRVTVYARATDGLGRIVGHTWGVSPSGEGPVELMLSLADLIAPHLRVEVFAVHTNLVPPGEHELHGAAYAFTRLPVKAPWP